MPNRTAVPDRARHLAATIPVLALSALIAACNTGTAASPVQSNTPAPTAPSTASPSPTSTPTPTPLPSPSFNADQIKHPTGTTDVVLRMEVGGGFVPMGFFLTQAPTFTLYGDGTVIFQQIDNRQNSFDAARLPWLVGHLDEEAIQALLSFAMREGRLGNARENYDQGMVADAPTTVFDLNAGGQSKRVSVAALFELPDPGPDAADRQGFFKLSKILSEFQNQQELGEVTPYQAELYRVVLSEGFGEPVGDALEWPWDDVAPDDFVAGDEGGAIANLDGEHVSDLLEIPTGGHPGVWAMDPDENLVQLGVRPLLPDEIATIEEANS